MIPSGMITTGKISSEGHSSLADEDLSHLTALCMERIVTVGDASSVGFTYFTKFIEWQGLVRETVGFEFFPDYMAGFTGEVVMLTMSCSCEFLGSLWPGDRVRIKVVAPWVRLAYMQGLYFYYRVTDDGEKLVARGEQLWMNAHRKGDTFTPGPWPANVVDGVRRIGGDVSRALVE